MAKKRKTTTRARYNRLVQSRVTDELYQRIERHAEAESISTSSYIRRLLQNHVPGGV